MNRWFLLAFAAVVVVLAVWFATGSRDDETGDGDARSAPSSTSIATAAPIDAPPTGRLTDLLDLVAVVDQRPSRAGYERACGVGRGCVFGPACERRRQCGWRTQRVRHPQ